MISTIPMDLFSQVYKVLTGSPADKDGRIRKGDRILSINGKSMKGITHRESLAILKVRLNQSHVYIADIN